MYLLRLCCSTLLLVICDQLFVLVVHSIRSGWLVGVCIVSVWIVGGPLGVPFWVGSMSIFAWKYVFNWAEYSPILLFSYYEPPRGYGMYV